MGALLVSRAGVDVAAALCIEAAPIEVSFGSRTHGAGFLLPVREASRVDRMWSACSDSATTGGRPWGIDNPRLCRIDIAAGSARAFTVYGDCSVEDRSWSSVLEVPLWGSKYRVTTAGEAERVTYGDVRAISALGVVEQTARTAANVGFSGQLVRRAAETFERLARLGWPQALSYSPASSRLKLDVSASDAKAIANAMGALCGSADASRVRRIARLVGGAFAYVSLSIDHSGQLDWRVYSRPLEGLDTEQVLAMQDRHE